PLLLDFISTLSIFYRFLYINSEGAMTSWKDHTGWKNGSSTFKKKNKTGGVGRMSRLLVNECPVMVVPSLAMKLGLNEAVVLQQIHYWVEASLHVVEGRKWVYKTYREWQRQLPFWSESTIKRAIRSLESQGYLLSANWNRLKLDKTKWYTIDYERLMELENEEVVFFQDRFKQLEWKVEDGCLIEVIPEIHKVKNEVPFSDIDS
ncbi:hypothetical protein V7182_05825, partial [Neobacillus drentensis]